VTLEAAMARIANRLTAKAVEKYKNAGMYADGDGLYFRVKEGGGAKGWLFRFKIDGKARAMGLGGYPVVSLAEAREKAAEARKLTRQGIDPIEARDATSALVKAVTFDAAAAAYVAEFASGWKHAKTPKRWLATCTAYASPVIGDKDVAAITADDIHRILAPIWVEKHETAITLRGRLEAVLDWATVKGYRQGANPATWRGNLKHMLHSPKQVRRIRPVKHHAALPWQDLPAFMVELRAREALAARALEITILCATRTMETLAVERFEIAGDLWTIPPARMKTGKEHRIPLSAQAAAIFDSLPHLHGSTFVFPGYRAGKSLSNMAMEMMLRRMGLADITVHGFRSTFRDWAAEETNFPREIIELCLAHDIGSEVERAYRRSDLLFKRKELMQMWADYACKNI
jgi:integrase